MPRVIWTGEMFEMLAEYVSDRPMSSGEINNILSGLREVYGVDVKVKTLSNYISKLNLRTNKKELKELTPEMEEYIKNNLEVSNLKIQYLFCSKGLGFVLQNTIEQCKMRNGKPDKRKLDSNALTGKPKDGWIKGLKENQTKRDYLRVIRANSKLKKFDLVPGKKYKVENLDGDTSEKEFISMDDNSLYFKNKYGYVESFQRHNKLTKVVAV